MQPFLGYPLKHYRLKTLMLMLCGFNFLGWIIYALGALSGSLATILVARVITGLAGGPTWLSTYVARSTSTELRSHYMQYVSLSVGLGYGIGPFIGGALYAICSSLDCDGRYSINTRRRAGSGRALLSSSAFCSRRSRLCGNQSWEQYRVDSVHGP